MKLRWLFIVTVVIAICSFPSHWYPTSVRLQFAKLFGASDYQSSPASMLMPMPEIIDEACEEDIAGWRKQQTIESVTIEKSSTCVADNPYAIAAFVRGTNNVSDHVLHQSGLTPDSIEKHSDLDGDGDPDMIHIRLEVVELNGISPESNDPTTQFSIAPGIMPGFWVFAPKHFGMATKNFESAESRALLRAPSPSIRIEQGDQVQITLENSHYMPHTIHFHGVDHSFVDSQGEGNDGVPIASEIPVLPGKSRTYEMQPRNSGTKFYHCHVQPHVHVMMGLQGMFVIEENKSNNWVQTLNIGAGKIRSPSVASKELYDSEYDLHYMDIDADLNNRVQKFNDVRLITKSMHREYNITDATQDYYILNGRSFPYTFQESLITVKPDQKIKLRIANGGRESLAFHTHGHNVTITHRDGNLSPQAAQFIRDVVFIAPAQRIDLDLDTKNDGLHSYGEGVWLFHDHQYKGVTTNGIGPGGHISAIVYQEYLQDNGWPKTLGVGWNKYFTQEYYRKEQPVWESYSPSLFSDTETNKFLLARLVIFSMSLSAMLIVLITIIISPRRW